MTPSDDGGDDSADRPDDDSTGDGSVAGSAGSVVRILHHDPDETVLSRLTAETGDTDGVAYEGTDDPERARERIPTLLDRFGLTAADDRIESYSKGMKQKTSVIQAIVHEPDVLFLDEPTSGLDPNAARTLKEVLTELRDGGTAVFLSTHVLGVVDELADTVGLLSDGRLLAEDDPERLVADRGGETLEDAFVELTNDAELSTRLRESP